MKIYNSLTFQKEDFKSLKPKDILMYVCGPTVYDSPHLGHAKSALAFDLISRYFKFKGFNVKLVKNYTDIDDKIIKRANERGIDYNTLSEQFIKEYEEIMKVLNVQKDYKNPRATEVIDFIITLIVKLIEKGKAYEKNGSVYFSVKSFSNYSSIFQNIAQEEEEENTLNDQDTNYGEDKEDRRDFALWKKWKEGEPYWESPWGRGRPGWHIECSAMAINLLGDTIDIHGGGQDLKSPHHKNEIAQSEAYTGKPFANYFMHNGFVNIDNEKMSKSLGNFFLVSDIIKEYDPMVVRLFLISSHYRKSINYSIDTISQARKNYSKLINTIKKIKEAQTSENNNTEIENLTLHFDKVKKNIIKALDDDFNTPVAIAEIMSLFREINKNILEKKIEINENFKKRFFIFIEDIDRIFGIFPNLEKRIIVETYGKSNDDYFLVKKLVDLILELRHSLRKRKMYDLSDQIRDNLRELGINVEDN